VSLVASDAVGTRDQASRLRDLVNSLRAREHESSRSPAPVVHTPPELPPARARCPVVAVTSGKGGVGKSCTAVNLSAALARFGLGISLLDADAGLANADVLCGVTPKRRLDLAHLGARSPESLAIDTPFGFELIPGAVGPQAGGPRTLERAAREAVARCGTRDLLVVDTGGGVGPEVTSFVLASDLALVVATPEPTSLADAYALIKVLVTRTLARSEPIASTDGDGPSGIHRPGRLVLVVNQASDEAEALRVHDRLNAVAARFLGCRVPMIGWIARDAQVVRSVRSRRPFVDGSPDAAASKGIRDLGRRVLDTLNMLGASDGSPEAG
jgi:flagellar biosynthesis protein FlhG